VHYRVQGLVSSVAEIYNALEIRTVAGRQSSARFRWQFRGLKRFTSCVPSPQILWLEHKS
jgi:hypothetical protein